MWTRSEGQGEVMLSGQNTAYLMERGLGMLRRVQFVGNHYQIIHSPAEVPEDITKVSVYLHEGDVYKRQELESVLEGVRVHREQRGDIQHAVAGSIEGLAGQHIDVRVLSLIHI